MYFTKSISMSILFCLSKKLVVLQLSKRYWEEKEYAKFGSKTINVLSTYRTTTGIIWNR
jgi:hypothetical protein